MVERIIEACAKHRFLVLFAVLAAGLGAYSAIRRVKVDAIPDLSEPQALIYTEWMGRDPMLLEEQVTSPLVSKLTSAPGVTEVRGISMFGMSFIYVLFDEDTDVYWARSRIMEYLAGSRLPEGVSPRLGPDATGIGWVFQYTLVDESGNHGLEALREYQDFTLKNALGSVRGVAEVATVGGYERQYQVTVQPERLRAHGVSFDDVVAAVRASSNEVGGRILEMSGREYYVRGRGYVDRLDDLEAVVVRAHGPGNRPLRVGDVAAVQFGPEIRRGVYEWNGRGEAVGGVIVMRWGENAAEVIERVRDKLDEIEPRLPPGMAIELAYDRSALIHRSIDTLEHALIVEAIVVALVIILFLLHVRSSLLPILSLPLAVALAFIPMYFLDIPSTIMSLGGIAIAIGATVDAEIVMIEASHKKLEHAPPGADRHRLLAEAAREVTPAIFFSLLIIAVAFLPVFALEGQAGRLFKPLAYTKTFVMLASAVLSITFAPALRDLLIRGRIRPEERHPISRAIIAVYRPFVWVALRKPKTTVAIGLLALLSAIPIYMQLSSEFMPELDEGDILYMPVTFPNISVEEAKRQLQLQDQVLKSFPEVASVAGKIGRADSATDPAPLTMVETTVRLKPRDQWRPGVDAADLRREMEQALRIPGWRNVWTMPIKNRIDMQATGIRSDVGVKVLGRDLAEVERIGVALERVLSPIDGTVSATYERNLGGLYIDIIPRDDVLPRHGLNRGDLQRFIEGAIGGTPVAVTIDGRKRFSINVRYPQDRRDDLEGLRRLLVPVPVRGGAMAPMDGAGMPREGALRPAASDVRHAQNMDMGGRPGAGRRPGRPSIPVPDTMSDAPMMSPMPSTMPAPMPQPMGQPMERPTAPPGAALAWVPLGLLAEVKVVDGPPMVRDEDGFLAGYVSIDVDDEARDIGGWVAEAKQRVTDATAAGALTIPDGYELRWSGQYEQYEAMIERMKLVIPLTLLIVVLLLWFQFRNPVEVLIVMLSVPFALVGSVWLLWLTDYRLSTAVAVGIIALVGLAAQTGIVMIVYIDHAYRRRKAEGRIRNLDDIIAAHMEGTVQRVRPKLMTVATMLVGLVPLLWAEGSGADVMRRIAAPMVGGLITSAFLTLEIIPVISTYWRYEQLLHERLVDIDPRRRRDLRLAAWTIGGGCLLAAVTAVAPFYVAIPAALSVIALLLAGLLAIGGTAAYLSLRPTARRMVWPPQQERTPA